MPAVDPRLILVFIWIVGVAAAAIWLLWRRPAALPPLLIALLPAFFYANPRLDQTDLT